MWQRIKGAWAVLTGQAYAADYCEDYSGPIGDHPLWATGLNRAAQDWWKNGSPIEKPHS